MKKLLLFFCLIILNCTTQGQSLTDCTHAIPFLSNTECKTNVTLSNSELFYSLVAQSSDLNVNYTLAFGSTGHVHNI